MEILITGISSFTGAWFARQLAEEGHAVVGTLRQSTSGYDALSSKRIAMCQAAGVKIAEGIVYGRPTFLSLLDQGFEVVGWHGADVGDYKSLDYDVVQAAQASTTGVREACDRARAAGTRKLIVTGTVAEPFGGLGDDVEQAASPYGLSKMISWLVIDHYAHRAGLMTGKFVIPNPFGRYEQARFCSYLIRSWAAGKRPEVRSPDYVRDNIPVDKCAQAYAAFATSPLEQRLCRPSGYIGTQGDFTARFAREIGQRLHIDTPFLLARQTEFAESRVRINSQSVAPGWNEAAFWDDLARYYAEHILAAGPKA